MRARHLGLGALLLFVSGPASAHIGMDWPPPRDNQQASQKAEPCGNLVRSDNPTVLQAGETITVEFRETIYHPGWYRLSWSWGSDEGFTENIIADCIPHNGRGNSDYAWEIIVPDAPCDTCTLQLVQVMTDKGTGYDSPTGWMEYYACADVVVTGSGGGGPEIWAGADPSCEDGPKGGEAGETGGGGNGDGGNGNGGNGDGSGTGNGSGDGNGTGNGNGSGDGNGTGSGDGNGTGSGSGSGDDGGFGCVAASGGGGLAIGLLLLAARRRR